MRICDHWSTDPPGLRFEPPKLVNFALMRIRIQLFTLMRMRIRIQLPKTERIRIRNPGHISADPRRPGWDLIAAGLGAVDAGPRGVAIQKLRGSK